MLGDVSVLGLRGQFCGNWWLEMIGVVRCSRFTEVVTVIELQKSYWVVDWSNYSWENLWQLDCTAVRHWYDWYVRQEMDLGSAKVSQSIFISTQQTTAVFHLHPIQEDVLIEVDSIRMHIFLYLHLKWTAGKKKVDNRTRNLIEWPSNEHYPILTRYWTKRSVTLYS